VTQRQRRWLIPASLFALFTIAGYVGWELWDGVGPVGPEAIAVNVPALSLVAESGRVAYDRRCAQCHGPHGAGSPTGPPLVHPIYRTAHHADVAFSLAVQRGVRAHHWRGADMPPQPDVRPDEVTAITRYIRELQAANGIK
jgi:mono/diheme cytochrome c family protein